MISIPLRTSISYSHTLPSTTFAAKSLPCSNREPLINSNRLGLAGIGSLITGIAALIGTWSSYQAKPELPQPTQHAYESRLNTIVTEAHKAEGRSGLFDGISTTAKRGIWRFITGDMPSEQASAKQDFKLTRNAEMTLQDKLDPILLTITDGSAAKETILKHTARIKDERAEYYALMQETITLAEKHPTSTIGKWIKDYQTSQLAKNIAALDENDQATVIRLYQDLGGAGHGIGTRAERFYKNYVEQVIKKHEPEKVAECLAAGDAFFAEIQKANTAQQEEYTRVQENITAITAHNETLHKWFYLGGGLSGLGILGLAIAGKLAHDEEEAKKTRSFGVGPHTLM